MTTAERAREPQARKSRKSRGLSANALTSEGSESVALNGAVLSVRQYRAAQKLAIGYSQQQAAIAANVDERTIRRWLDDPEFDRLVTDLQAQTWSRIGNKIAALFEHCIEIHFAMLRGDIPADDPIYLEAKEIILRYGGRQALVELAADSGSDPTHPPAGGPPAIESTFVSPA